MTNTDADNPCWPKAIDEVELNDAVARRLAAGEIEERPKDGEDLREFLNRHFPITGVALSGGGIRSATFALGVFQAMADGNWLKHIDYLSTVSGGGYFGGFFGRLYTRSTKEPSTNDYVRKALSNADSWEYRWLRENGRYLAPNGTGDFLTGAAVSLRNWLGVQIVMLLFLFGCLLIPLAVRSLFSFDGAQAVAPVEFRYWFSPVFAVCLTILAVGAVPTGTAYWLVPSGRHSWHEYAAWIVFALAASFFVLAVALSFGLFRWLFGPIGSQVALVITWFAVACGFWWLVAYIVAVKTAGTDHLPFTMQFVRNRLSDWLGWILAIAGVVGAVAIVDSFGQTLYVGIMSGTLSVYWKSLTAFVGGLGILAASARHFAAALGGTPQSGQLNRYVGVAVNVVALVVVAAILIGLSTAAHALVWQQTVPPLQVDGIQRAALGWSARSHLVGSSSANSETSATLNFTADGDTKSHLVFNHSPCEPKSKDKKPKPGRIHKTEAWLGLLAAMGISLIAFRWSPFLNRSSYASLYAARITRAYLGASNPERKETSNFDVTDVVQDDGLPFSKYQPWKKGGPLHIVNMTFNETIEGRSNIEQRDRKGMHLAVGPAGMSAGSRHHAVWDLPRSSVEPAKKSRSPVAAIADAANDIFLRGSEAPSLRRVVLEKEDSGGANGDGTFHIFDQGMEESPVPGTNSKRPKPIFPEELNLGDWLAISGAAFSTGLGAQTNLGLSLLCGLANVRLGYWWDSGITPRLRSQWKDNSIVRRLDKAFAYLFPVQASLIDEFTAQFRGPQRKRWYLSDGGHIENMAVYELIRRRLPLILLSDAEQDPERQFSGLGNLIRKARIDFGAEIRFLTKDELKPWNPVGSPAFLGTLRQIRKATDDLSTKPSEDDSPEVHAALATIKYHDDTHGWLVYFKPSLTGDEPQDILQYALEHQGFPHQTTLDQFFGEGQWESYRRLGQHIGEQFLDWHQHMTADDEKKKSFKALVMNWLRPGETA